MILEQPTVPCTFCGTPTTMTGTKKCDNCWELDRRLGSVSPEVLCRMMVANEVKGPDTGRLEWMLKHAYAKALGAGADDWDYHPITTREQIDTAMKRAEGGNGTRQSQ